MFSFPFLLTLYAGFTHAFEADHLLAVGSIVSSRNNVRMSLRDGIFWGLGHASTILFIGLIMIILKVSVPGKYFHYFEATVGCMLIVLAVYRLIKFYQNKKISSAKPHYHLQIANSDEQPQCHSHSLAYGVGLVHGLAGSGALVAIVMSQMKGPADGLTYLLLFATACIGGMMLAAGLFSFPFSKRKMQARLLQQLLIIASSALCVLYGSKVIYENLIVSY